MPGPFPGMDPYLEDPALWPGVHLRLIADIEEALNQELPEDYVATAGERVYVVQSERSIYPDVTILHRPPAMPVEVSSGSVAVLQRGDPPEVLTVYPVEIHEGFVEIRSTSDLERVVTVIEVLSYTNKTAGADGQRLYREKQREILKSDTHLLEIDLLRRGEHVAAVPRSELALRGTWDYLVCLHRADRPYDYECWPRRVRERLPQIRVPLLPGTPDAILDLQAVLGRTYDAAAYRRRIDYRSDPVVTLPAEDITWADLALREKGLRS